MKEMIVFRYEIALDNYATQKKDFKVKTNAIAEFCQSIGFPYRQDKQQPLSFYVLLPDYSSSPVDLAFAINAIQSFCHFQKLAGRLRTVAVLGGYSESLKMFS